jgi:hypothetical protein
MKTGLRIPPEVAERLGYYVYLYVDPRTGKPFYVGKGQRGRVLAHLSAKGESRKVATLAELKAAGLEPRLEILAHALPSEEAALRLSFSSALEERVGMPFEELAAGLGVGLLR